MSVAEHERIAERERVSEATKRMMRALGRSLPASTPPGVLLWLPLELGFWAKDHEISAEALNDLADRLRPSGNTEAAAEKELRSAA